MVIMSKREQSNPIKLPSAGIKHKTTLSVKAFTRSRWDTPRSFTTKYIHIFFLILRKKIKKIKKNFGLIDEIAFFN